MPSPFHILKSLDDLTKGLRELHAAGAGAQRTANKLRQSYRSVQKPTADLAHATHSLADSYEGLEDALFKSNKLLGFTYRHTLASLGIITALNYLKNAVSTLIREGVAYVDTLARITLETDTYEQHVRDLNAALRDVVYQTRENTPALFALLTELTRRRIADTEALKQYMIEATRYARITNQNAEQTAEWIIVTDRIAGSHVAMNDGLRSLYSTLQRAREVTRSTVFELQPLIDTFRDLSYLLDITGQRFIQFQRQALAALSPLSEQFVQPQEILQLFETVQRLDESAVAIRAFLHRAGQDFGSYRDDIIAFTEALASAAKTLSAEELRRLGHIYEQTFGIPAHLLRRLRRLDLEQWRREATEVLTAPVDTAQKRWERFGHTPVEMMRRLTDAVSGIADVMAGSVFARFEENFDRLGKRVDKFINAFTTARSIPELLDALDVRGKGIFGWVEDKIRSFDEKYPQLSKFVGEHGLAFSAGMFMFLMPIAVGVAVTATRFAIRQAIALTLSTLRVVFLRPTAALFAALASAARGWGRAITGTITRTIARTLPDAGLTGIGGTFARWLATGFRWLFSMRGLGFLLKRLLGPIGIAWSAYEVGSWLWSKVRGWFLDEEPQKAFNEAANRDLSEALREKLEARPDRIIEDFKNQFKLAKAQQPKIDKELFERHLREIIKEEGGGYYVPGLGSIQSFDKLFEDLRGLNLLGFISDAQLEDLRRRLAYIQKEARLGLTDTARREFETVRSKFAEIEREYGHLCPMARRLRETAYAGIVQDDYLRDRARRETLLEMARTAREERERLSRLQRQTQAKEAAPAPSGGLSEEHLRAIRQGIEEMSTHSRFLRDAGIKISGLTPDSVVITKAASGEM